jgi:hypothetical protein
MSEQEDKVRKTLSLTHKQAGLSAASIAALTAVLVGPLSQVFQTKLDAAKVVSAQEVQAHQLVELRSILNENKRDIIDKINDAVRGIASQVDKHETRIVNLEFIQMKKHKGE